MASSNRGEPDTPSVSGFFLSDCDQPIHHCKPTTTAAAVHGRVATGERAGPLCFAARGFSLHAATRIDAGDRTRKSSHV